MHAEWRFRVKINSHSNGQVNNFIFGRYIHREDFRTRIFLNIKHRFFYTKSISYLLGKRSLRTSYLNGNTISNCLVVLTPSSCDYFRKTNKARCRVRPQYPSGRYEYYCCLSYWRRSCRRRPLRERSDSEIIYCQKRSMRKRPYTLYFMACERPRKSILDKWKKWFVF